MRIRVGLLAVLVVAFLAQPAATQQTLQRAYGTFEYEPTTTGILITAPHGTFDRNTATIAIEVARRLKSGYVVARGFTPGVRINVNRPTEGSSESCDEEQNTQRAREVYADYNRLVAAASGDTPLRLYVEVHGNSRAENAGNIEVATKGVSAVEAADLRASFPSISSLIEAEWPSYPNLLFLIQPVDRIYWTASCAKRIGTLASDRIPRALHFEFPAAAREDSMILATATLIARVVERVPLP